MKGKRVKTYIATLMADKKFREKFDQQYQNLCIAEQIAQARYHAHLTQADQTDPYY